MDSSPQSFYAPLDQGEQRNLGLALEVYWVTQFLVPSDLGWAELFSYIILLPGCPSPGHQNLPNASPSTTSLPPARVISMHCSQSLMKLWFSPVHAQQKLKTASLSLPASLPPSSWSAEFYCLLQRSPGTPGLGASLLSTLDPTVPLVSAAHAPPEPFCLLLPCPRLTPRHMQPSVSCPSRSLLQDIRSAPKCPREHVGQQSELNSITSTSFVSDAS